MKFMREKLKAALSLAFGLWTAAAVAGGYAQYCVIDLSGGPTAESYPVTYLDAAPAGGFNTDEYKTTKLVLKCVEAGSFIMGQDQTDESHRVTLTKPFCIGVFQVTQKQWSLVMGTNPWTVKAYEYDASSKFIGDTHPAVQVSYHMIRGENTGAAWPIFNAVDEGSFLAVLRAKTGIDFDLPTEAQWEYACRAGTTTDYNTGATEDDLKRAGWYDANSGGATHPVGEKTPNDWGLYDMHGNVWEWTLDWKGDLAYGIDPVGVSSARYRTLRGGGYATDGYYESGVSEAASWGRENDDYPSQVGKGDYGFRLVAPAAEAVPTVVAAAKDVSVVYDGEGHGIAVSVTTPADGATVEYALAKDGPWQAESPLFTDACAATKVWYRALADGYAGATNAATVTVSPRPISNATVTLLLPDGGYKYDGAAKEPAVSVTDTLAGFSSSDYDAPVYSDNVNAGTAKVVVTGIGNYAGTVEATFAIAPRSLTFTSASAEWAWDGEAHSRETTPTVSGDGFVGTDGATFSGFKSVTAPGSYENTFSYAFTDGTVAANYTVATTFGTLIVYSYKAETKEDGTLSITGVSDDTAKDSDLYIPEEIDGKKVTEVAEGAFANKTTQCAAESVTLSKYVTKVDASAFRGNESLKTVTFAEKVYTPENVETKLEIGANAFSSSGVEEIVVPESVSHIGKYAFANCKNLKKVTIKSGTTVDADAFFCSGITQGKKPEVMTVGEFSVDPVTGSATMLLSGTGGAISTSGLRVLYGPTPSSMTEEVPFTVGDTELTSEGCSVTVTAEAPEGAEGAAFFKAVVD